MKPLVIYHANCADGFGAAFAAWLKFGDDAEYLSMQYGKQSEEFCTSLVFDREVFILDFSFPRPQMNELFRRATRVVWLDHHKTAFEMWCGKAPGGVFQSYHENYDKNQDLNYVALDNNRSGALIAWDYFHPGKEVPMLFRHIDDYDRWQFKLDGTKAFNKALWSYAPWSFEQWKEKFMFGSDDTGLGASFFFAEGEAILRAHNQNVQSVVKGAAMECFIPHQGCPAGMEHDIGYAELGLAANCPPHLTSDVGHELATQSGAFGLCWTLGRDGTAKCSLRSNGDYDVSAIAKALGGGGHRNAAGFETDINTLMGWLKC